jgi:hypothetical protein
MRVRRVFVNLILAGFIAASAYDIATDQEHWPFSQYPMFSVQWTANTFTWLRVFGVTPDGREFPLDENRFVHPFDQSRLPKALRQILQRENGEAEIREALADLMTRYENLRRDDGRLGPPLAATRLYELEWTIARDAGNVDRPDRKTLIAQVPQP